MIILDTNVVSETMRPEPAVAVVEFLDGLDADDVYLTALSVAEIRFGLLRLPAGKHRDMLTHAADALIADEFAGRALPFDVTAAEVYGQLTAQREAGGRPLPVIDAMIASICVVHDATLVTRNTKDFEGLGLPLINPW